MYYWLFIVEAVLALPSVQKVFGVSGSADALRGRSVDRFCVFRELADRGRDEAGHRRHRCLYVGRESDEELVPRVRTVLEHCRARQQGLQELTAYVEIAEMLQGAIQASMHAMFHQI